MPSSFARKSHSRVFCTRTEFDFRPCDARKLVEGFEALGELNRAIDGMVHAERVVLAVPLEDLVERVLTDSTDFEDWVAAASCVERLNSRLQLIRSALDEQQQQIA